MTFLKTTLLLSASCFLTLLAMASSIETSLTIDPGPPQVGCTGDVLTLGSSPLISGGTAPYQITWFVLGDTTDHSGLSNAYVEQPTFTLTADVVYGVLVEDALGAVSTAQVDSKIFNVSAGPDVTYCPSGAPIEIGTPVVPDPNASYSWEIQGMPGVTTGLNEGTSPRPFASPAATTIYEITGTYNACSDTDLVTVTVGSNIADAGTDANACIGTTISVGNVANPGTYTYAWSDQHGFIDNYTAANPNLTATFVPATNPYDIYLSATSDDGCIKLDTISITVVSAPDLSNRKVDFCNPNVRVGEDITDEVGNTYAWSETGNPGNTSDFSSSTSRDPLVFNPGDYTVTVTNSAGCSSSLDIHVEATCSADAGDCVVQSDYCITAGTAVDVGINTDDALSFSWSPTTNLANSSVSETVATPAFSTIYTLTVNYATYTCEYKYFINLAPTITKASDEVLCQNTSTTIGANGLPGWSYSWSPTTGLSDPNAIQPTYTASSETGLFSYVITGTNPSFACVIKDTVIIEVLDDSADAGADVSYCTGSSITIGSPSKPNFSYTWIGPGLDNSSIAQPTATPSGTVTYTLNTVNNITGCTDSDMITLTEVSDIIADTGGASVEICTNGSTQLGGTDMSGIGYIYSWTPTTGLSDPSSANPIASPTTTTTYTLTVQNGAVGCFDTDEIEVIVSPSSAPTANAGVNQSNCEGLGVTIGTAAEVGHTYLRTPATGLDDHTDAQTTATVGATAQLYTLRVEDVGGCISYDQVLVSPIKISLNAGTDQMVCTGDVVQIGEESEPGFSYLWTPLTGLSSPVVSDPIVTAGSTTQTYTLTKTDGATCYATDDVTLTIMTPPNNDAGADQSICDTPINIGPAVPNANYSYSWSPSLGLDDTNIANPSVDPNEIENTTIYTLTVTDNLTGCSNTGSVTITPESSYEVYAPSVNICSTPVIIGLDPGANHTYAWNPTAGLSNASISNPAALPLSTTMYTVTITNTMTSCVKTATVEVVVEAIPSLDLADIIVCSDSNTIIGVTDPSIADQFQNWSWSPASDLSSANVSAPTLVNPQVTRTYTVAAEHRATGCLVTETFTINVDDQEGILADAGSDITICQGENTTIGSTALVGMSYQWSPTVGINDYTIAQPIVSPAQTTTYTLTVTDVATGCIAVDQVIVTIDDFGINAGDDFVACKNAFVNLPGTDLGAGYTYTWTPSFGMNDNSLATPSVLMSTPTTFTLVVTETATGCTASDQIFVDVSADTAPTQIAGIDQTICYGESVMLGPLDDGTSTYSWLPVTGLDDANVAKPTASPLVTTTYTLTANTGTCSSQSSVTITVLDDFVADAGTDQNICNGGATTIGSTSVLGLTYTWSPAAGLSDASIANPSANPSSSTIYTLVVEDVAGCQKADQVTITVDTNPVSNAGPNVSICDDGENIQIGSNPQSGMTYAWSPASGLTNSTIANPVASPVSTTTYTLTTTDSSTGCTSSDMVIVSVTDCSFVCPTLDSLVLSQAAICSGESFSTDIYRSQNIESLSLYYNSGSTLTAADIYAGSATIIDDNIAVNQSVVINEITYWGGDTIELWNTGADTVDISSWWICSRFNYAELNTLNLESGSLDLNPGEYVVLTGFAFDDQEADVAIYNTNSFANSAAMVDFIQYGNSGIGRESVAAAKGIWTPGTFINPVSGIGQILSYDGTGNSPSDWSEFGTSTYFADNTNKTANVQTPYSGITLPENNTGSPIVYNLYAALGAGDALIQQCSLVSATTITVNPLPTIIIGADQSICLGDTATLSVSGGTSYVWSPAIAIDDATAATPKVYPTSTTKYYVDVTDINGCAARDSVTITINPIPDLATTDSGICNGESIDLATLVMDNNGVTGAFAYYSSIMDATNETGAISSTVSPTSSTTYFIRKNTSSTPVCNDIAPVTITIVDPPLLVANNISVCEGTFVDLSSRISDLNSVPTGITFYPTQLDADNQTNALGGTFVNPSTTTTYYARKNAALPAMCFDTEEMVVTVTAFPDLVTRHDTICFGSSVWLDTLVTDLNPTPGTYTYYNNLVDAQNGNNAIPATATPLDTATFYVRKETSTTPPCATVDSIKVYVESCNFDIALKKTLSAGQATSVNPGDSVNFDITVYNQGIVTAYDVLVTDYLDPNSILADANWTPAGMNATRTIDEIAVADSAVLSIRVQVNPSFMGLSVINTAEVSYATNIDGRMINIEDIDSNPNNTNGDDTGGTLNDPTQDDVVTDDGTIDEDDHDIEDVAVIQVFDLALNHTFTAGDPSSYLPGDIVSLDILVVNEGTLNAYDISVINYDVPGLIYLDGGWVDENGYYSFEIPSLAAGANQTLTLRYTVDPQYTAQTIINNSEIAFATQTDGSGMNTIDDDSTADSIEGNPAEDDFNSLTIPVTQGFDLALRKVLSTGQLGVVYPGDTINFDIEVYNQGIEDAFEIVITDYLPANTSLVSDTWTMNGSNAAFTISELLIGQDTTVQIAIKVDEAFALDQMINVAELSFATDVDNSTTLKDDQDSDFDTNPVDLGGGVNVVGEDNQINDRGVNDEDDHDPEDVVVCNIQITSTPSHPTCTGGTDGSIDVMIAGGTAPFMYQWADGNGFVEDISGLAAGTYTISVTDANGCAAEADIAIDDPELFSINATTTNADCGIVNGSITLNISGATPMTYNWDNDAYDGQSALTGLTAGTFSVTVTDDLGCQKDTLISITSSSGLTALADERDISCTGADDGFVGLATSGGTAPYAYDWSDDAFDGLDTLRNLISGVYDVTIEDANNCVFISSFTITEPAAIAVDTAVQRLACAGDGNGIIDLFVTGGTEPYTYNWNNGLPAQQDQVGLSAGNFQYTVTDANGCEYADSVIIADPTEFVITATYNGPVCEGQTLEITGLNGVSYDWIGPNGFTSSDPVLTFANATTSLSGTYTLRASNINACRDTIDLLAEVFPTTPTAILTDSTAICNMNFGAAENAIDLNDMLVSGDLSGTWTDIDASGALIGSIFTATPSMADLTYQFSYTIAGSGSDECGDRVYTTKVHVNGCGFRLSLDKEVSEAGDLGDTVTYTLTVNNLGDVDAYDVVVKDHIPSGFTFIQGLNTGWSAVTGGVEYTFSDPIMFGASASVDIRLIIDDNHQATSITNTAEISFGSSTSGGGLAMDTNSTYDNFSGTAIEDDESSATLALTQSYDLSLNLEFIEGQSPELSAGDPVTYYVIVSNEGTLNAFDVAVQFNFPIDLTFNAGSSTGWSDFGTFAGYTIGSLPIGATDTIPINFNLITGSATISAEVSAEILAGSSMSGGPISGDSDSTPNNDIPTEDDQDALTIAIDQTYDLAIDLSTATDSVDAGATMVFNIMIVNQSTLPADDVTIVVYVPDGFIFPASLNPGWTAGTNGRFYFTFNGSIPVGMDETLTLSLIAGDNLLEGSSLNLSAEIVSGSFVTGGVLLADSDGTFDDISSNDPSSEDNHDSILLYVRSGGCSTITFNGATIIGESCIGGDGAIDLDITNPSNYSFTWSPDEGTTNTNGNIKTGLLAGRYAITVTDNSNSNCFAELTIDVGYDCIPPIDIYEAYVPFNGLMEICMDDTFINLPKSVSTAVMCNDGSGTNPPAVIGSTTANPECISLQAMNGYVGKFPEMLCVIHCTDDIVPICDTTLISITVVPQQDIETVQIPAGQSTTICLDPGVLQVTTPVTANSVCDLGDASSVAVSDWDGTCATLNPAPGFSGISTDTICLVSCYNDDPRFCDTTYIIVEVTNALCPDYFDQSLIVETGSDMADLLEVTVDAPFFGFSDNFSLTNNGVPYAGNLTPTGNDSLRFYNVSVPFATVSPPYAITWSFNGFNFSGVVNNVFDLVDSMQVWDPAGNWLYNPILNQIETQNLTTDYSLITLDDGVLAFPVSINLFTNPQQTIIEVPTGLNVLVIPEVCADTVIVAFSAPSPSEVYDTIFVNEMTEYCLDISELTTTPISVINYCAPASGDNAMITIVGNDPCIDLEGLVIGNDTACFVLTDEYGFQDTISYYLYIRDTAVGPPIATSDTLQLFKNQFANIPILMNDDTVSALTTLEIINQPLNGDATLNPDNTIRFVPDLDYCSDTDTEIIQYIICNIDGCDIGTIEIQVLCDELSVNNGFSPNGDGVNDAFYIDAALLYPNNELRVYNRWGNQVLRQKGYQNDWEGTWDGGNLPDGVYWYSFDTGEGQQLSGYVVLYRN